MNFNFNQILAEVFGAFVQTQATKASVWIKKQVGNPTSPAGQAAVALGKAALAIGVETIKASPDHPEIRDVAGTALDTISQALTPGGSLPSAQNDIPTTEQ